MAGMADAAATLVAGGKHQQHVFVAPQEFIQGGLPGLVLADVAGSVTVGVNPHAGSKGLGPHGHPARAGQAARTVVAQVLEQDLCLGCHAVARIIIGRIGPGRRAAVAGGGAGDVGAVKGSELDTAVAVLIVVVGRRPGHDPVSRHLAPGMPGSRNGRRGVRRVGDLGIHADAVVQLSEPSFIAVQAGICDADDLAGSQDVLVPDGRGCGWRAAGGRVGLDRPHGILVEPDHGPVPLQPGHPVAAAQTIGQGGGPIGIDPDDNPVRRPGRYPQHFSGGLQPGQGGHDAGGILAPGQHDFQRHRPGGLFLQALVQLRRQFRLPGIGGHRQTGQLLASGPHQVTPAASPAQHLDVRGQVYAGRDQPQAVFFGLPGPGQDQSQQQHPLGDSQQHPVNIAGARG